MPQTRCEIISGLYMLDHEQIDLRIDLKTGDRVKRVLKEYDL
jgi:hypothetical protein